MFTKKWLHLIMLLLTVVVGCQPSASDAAIQDEPVAVEEIEVTRIVEVVNEVEVTRVVEGEGLNESLTPLLASEVRTYNSAVSGHEYKAFVTLPMSYAVTDISYPVVYVTDGGVYGVPTAVAASQLNFGQEMPEVIVVGIGYDTNNPMEWLELRGRDMGEDGAEAFLQFIQDELIPDIEANYRADPTDRTLAGHSLGGVFSLYALFHAPETFNRYIASSPGGVDDDCRVCKYEAAYATENDVLPAKLFLNVGELDMGVETLGSFFDTLEARGYEDFILKTAVMDGETHLSVRPRAFMSGLKWLFTEE